MRSNLNSLAVSLAFVAISYGFPSDSPISGLLNLFSKRTISPDDTCGSVNAGNNNNYTCDAASDAGGCCSQYGYCGNTTGMFNYSLYDVERREDDCAVGCQPAFKTLEVTMPHSLHLIQICVAQAMRD